MKCQCGRTIRTTEPGCPKCQNENSIACLRSEVVKLREQAAFYIAAIHRILVGKKAVVLSDYNGQPYGSSRPSMKGKEIEIRSISMDGIALDRIDVLPEGHRCYLPLEELEVKW